MIEQSRSPAAAPPRALAPFTAADLTLQPGAAPTVRDLVLAERLGFTKPANIRELIRRNRDEIESFGPLTERDDREAFPCGTEKARIGRPGTSFLLNRQQAMLVAILAKTEPAQAVRRQMIAVFDAAADGAASPASDEAPITRADFHVLTEAMRGVLRSMGELVDIERRVPPAAPQPPAVAPHAAPAADEAGFLLGIPQIARYLRLSEAQTRHLCSLGIVPTFRPHDRVRIADGRRRSGIVCASKAAINDWLASAHGATADASAPAEPEALATFMADCVVLDANARTPARALYEAYRAFAARRRFVPVIETRFGRDMAEHHAPSARATINGRNCNAYHGLRLRMEEVA